METIERAYLLERCLKLEQEIERLKDHEHALLAQLRAKIKQVTKQSEILESVLGVRVVKARSYPDGNRQCRTCGEAKPLAAFRKDSTKPSGYRHRCIECQRVIDRRRGRPDNAERQREWKKRNPEKPRIYNRRWRENNPEVYKESIRRRNARRKHTEAQP